MISPSQGELFASPAELQSTCHRQSPQCGREWREKVARVVAARQLLLQATPIGDADA
jgi:hypothetical protein